MENKEEKVLDTTAITTAAGSGGGADLAISLAIL